MKSERQRKIIELISENDIGTQEELADALHSAGFDVTQATVSRDIRELNLTKTNVDGNRQKYVIYSTPDVQLNDRYVNVLKEGFVSMSVAGNLLVIKTVSGMAMAVCAAVDAFEFEEEVGSIAGDDTIMVATKGEKDAGALMERILKIMR